MEPEVVKKRGRKKKIDVVQVQPVIEEESLDKTEKRKRGRKKKFETTVFKNNYIASVEESLNFKENVDISTEYKTNDLKFGNLCIQVHDKDNSKNLEINNYFKPNEDERCELNLSSDEEDSTIVKKNTNFKQLNYVKKANKNKIKNIRCYHCHHDFENSPFYLPIDYCSKLDRYKLFGNFCSPNCVKSFCMKDKIFNNKIYLVGQFYRSLFGQTFKINPAPSIFNLVEYGGDLTIEEFRKSFYSNSRYCLNNINTKVIFLN